MSKRKGLGRGFDSLIPTEIEREFDPTSEVDDSVSRTQNVLIEDIKPNPNQPRKTFDSSLLDELAGSIKQHGVLQPVVVIRDESGFILIAGERRWRAARQAGLKEIPAIVRTLDDQAQLEVALIENIQREDLSPLEMATSLIKLNQQFNQTFEAIAQRLGKAPSTVVNVTRLLHLPDPAKRALAKGKITEGHARQILALDEPKKQQELLDLILRHNWSVRRAEAFVRAYKEGGSNKSQAVRSSRTTTPETKRIGKRLKTEVELQQLARGGRILIRFKNDKDYKRLIKLLDKET